VCRARARRVQPCVYAGRRRDGRRRGDADGCLSRGATRRCAVARALRPVREHCGLRRRRHVHANALSRRHLQLRVRGGDAVSGGRRLHRGPLSARVPAGVGGLSRGRDVRPAGPAGDGLGVRRVVRSVGRGRPRDLRRRRVRGERGLRDGDANRGAARRLVRDPRPVRVPGLSSVRRRRVHRAHAAAGGRGLHEPGGFSRRTMSVGPRRRPEHWRVRALSRPVG
jgi:hypothetical protein